MERLTLFSQVTRERRRGGRGKGEKGGTRRGWGRRWETRGAKRAPEGENVGKVRGSLTREDVARTYALSISSRTFHMFIMLRCHCRTRDERQPRTRGTLPAGTLSASTSLNVHQMFPGASDIHDGRTERHQAVAMLSLPRLHGTSTAVTGVSRDRRTVLLRHRRWTTGLQI